MFKKIQLFFLVFAVLTGILVYLDLIPFYVILIEIGIYLAILIYGAAYIQSQIFIPTLYRLDGNEKEICLSFDDGPHPNTMHVLDILKKHGVKACFFCIGKQIEIYPDIMQRIVNEGHLIGNHTYSHSPFISLYSAQKFKAEIDQCNAILQKYSGRKNHPFRPPYGVTNPNIARALKDYPEKIIGWNLRSMDTVAKNPEKLKEKLLRKIKPGTILLFHDTQEISLKILDQFIGEVKNRGYGFTINIEPNNR